MPEIIMTGFLFTPVSMVTVREHPLGQRRKSAEELDMEQEEKVVDPRIQRDIEELSKIPKCGVGKVGEILVLKSMCTGWMGQNTGLNTGVKRQGFKF